MELEKPLLQCVCFVDSKSIPTSGKANVVAGFDVYKTLNKSKNIGYMSQKKFSLYENLSILEKFRIL